MNFKQWCIKRIRLMKEFKKFFHFDCPMDETSLFLDIVKLDKILEEKFNDYSDDMSMSDIIINKYGQKADDLINDLICLIDELPCEYSELSEEQLSLFKGVNE